MSRDVATGRVSRRPQKQPLLAVLPQSAICHCMYSAECGSFSLYCHAWTEYSTTESRIGLFDYRNSIPATTTVGHLQEKLSAAREQIYVDVCFWGGIIPDNVRDLRDLVKRGVVGFKCFLCPSGVPEFPHVSEQQVDDALAQVQDLDVTIAVRLKGILFVIQKRPFFFFFFLEKWRENKTNSLEFGSFTRKHATEYAINQLMAIQMSTAHIWPLEHPRWRSTPSKWWRVWH